MFYSAEQYRFIINYIKVPALTQFENNEHSAIGSLRWNSPELHSDQATFGDLERKDFKDLNEASVFVAFYDKDSISAYGGITNLIENIDDNGYTAYDLVAIPEPRFYGIFLGLFSISTVFHFRNRKDNQ